MKTMLGQLNDNNGKAKAILTSLIANTESGFDPCEIDVTGLAEAALDYIKQNEALLEGGLTND